MKTKYNKPVKRLNEETGKYELFVKQKTIIPLKNSYVRLINKTPNYDKIYVQKKLGRKSIMKLVLEAIDD